jgi:putative transposase
VPLNTLPFAKIRSTRDLWRFLGGRGVARTDRSPRLLSFLLAVLAVARSGLRTRGALALENLALRQQLAVLWRRRPRPPLAWTDRLFWVALSRAWSRWRDLLVLVKPATVVRWHRFAFRRFWTWRSRRLPGRPPVDRRTRGLVRQVALANPLWGAPRIHGQLLKLGIEISERQVSRLMPRAPRKPPSHTWRTFLTNHVGTLASIDFFTVPTATFRVFYVFVRGRVASVHALRSGFGEPHHGAE